MVAPKVKPRAVVGGGDVGVGGGGGSGAGAASSGSGASHFSSCPGGAGSAKVSAKLDPFFSWRWQAVRLRTTTDERRSASRMGPQCPIGLRTSRRSQDPDGSMGSGAGAGLALGFGARSRGAGPSPGSGDFSAGFAAAAVFAAGAAGFDAAGAAGFGAAAFAAGGFATSLAGGSAASADGSGVALAFGSTGASTAGVCARAGSGTASITGPCSAGGASNAIHFCFQAKPSPTTATTMTTVRSTGRTRDGDCGAGWSAAPTYGASDDSGE